MLDETRKRRSMSGFWAMLCGLAVGLSAFVMQGAAQFDKPTRKSAGLCGVIEAKAQRAAQAGPNKLLLIGGSGVTRGFNAQRMEAALDRPVRNFGLQASLGPQIILAEAKQLLRPGDTALLAFEFEHYTYDKPTAFAQEVLLGCRGERLTQQPLLDRIGFYLSVSPERWRDVLSYPAQAPKYRPPQFITEYGDRPLDPEAWPPVSKAVKDRLSLYQPAAMRVAPEAAGPQAIVAFLQWARATQVEVYWTLPNTIGFHGYLSRPRHAQIEAFYQDQGVGMLGEPFRAFLPIEMFYDTQYHLTPEGLRQRTDLFLTAPGVLEALAKQGGGRV